MPSASRVLCRIALVVLAAAAGVAPARAADPALRLYTLDCGRLAFRDFGMFADTGEYDGKPASLVDPCFVIRHPDGLLVWDTGLGDAIAGDPDGVDIGGGGIHLSVPRTLAGQLAAIDVAPGQVDFVAFSHMHFDHTGNANLFGASTWILEASALAAATAQPTPFGVEPASFSAYAQAKQKRIDGDLDVFGDGRVRILRAPGHTPGHQVLAVRLARAGLVVLAGDLYHSRANRAHRRVPGFNASRADTLASIDRIETLCRRAHCRLVIQHDPDDVAALPKAPAFLD